MWPNIGPLKSYGICYLAALLVHFFISWRMAKRNGVERRVWLSVTFLFSIGSITGAKNLYDLQQGQ